MLTPLYRFASFERVDFGADAISDILAATSVAPPGNELDIVVVIFWLGCKTIKTRERIVVGLKF